MSSEDTLLRATFGAGDDTDDLGIKVQADVHVEDDGKISDTNIHSSGTEIDPIGSEERDVLDALSNQVSNEITGIAPSQISLACGTSGSCSSDNEEGDSIIVQMTSSTTGKAAQNSVKGKARQFSRGNQLTPKESWGTKIATTRLKNTKNYISYHNITYTVPQGWFFQDKPPKVILYNVRLVIYKY